MESTRRQLKVVPPQTIKPLTQPVKQPLPDSPESKDSQKPENPPETNPQKKSKFPIKGLIILGILGGLGYGVFVPKSIYAVKADANVSTKDYKREIISLSEAGIIKSIQVKPDQDVSKGDIILKAESPIIKEEISRRKSELGQLNSELNNARIAIEQAESSLNQEKTKTRSAQKELEQAEKDLREFDTRLLPQRRQIEAENIGLKQQIIAEERELEKAKNKLLRYQKLIEQRLISRDAADELETKKDSIQKEINLIISRIQQNEELISSRRKELNDQVQRLESRLQEQRSQEQSAADNLSSLQKRVQQSRERIDFQESEIKRQEKRQENLVVKTKIQGTVLGKDFDQLENRSYQAGEEVLKIADLSILKVIISVRQEDYKLLEVGDKVKFYRQGRLEPYIAKVENKATAPSQKENDPKLYWDVTFSVENDRQISLKPGMTGYVSIETKPMTLFEKMRHEILKLVRQPMI